MTVSVLKTRFRKLPSRIISYRDFSNYQKANFINSLKEVLLGEENMESLLKHPNSFNRICTEIVIQHAPCKKKYNRGKSKPFMSKLSI